MRRLLDILVLKIICETCVWRRRRGRGGGARKVGSFQKKGVKSSPSFRFVQKFSLVQLSEPRAGKATRRYDAHCEMGAAC